MTETRMRWKLTELLARYQLATGQRATYEMINESTGIAISQLSHINNNRPKQVGLTTLERLLDFFRPALPDVNTSDLLEYIPPEP